MGILEDLVQSFLSSTPEFERYAPVKVEKPAGGGNVFVQKRDPNTGEIVRLRRPESMPLTAGERLVQEFEKMAQDPEATSDDVSQGGTFNILEKLGQITGFGSPKWAQGLDIDLQRGDAVPSPVSGTVDFVGRRGGFGNQVRVRGDDGREYWLSHLDAAQVKRGQRINAGQPVGLGGNTGSVIPGPGGDGSHLDLTVRQNNQFLQPSAIAELLKGFG